jgi:UDP-4-keto-D-QuiNAc 4-reductase
LIEKKYNILVSGASGFIGNMLIKELLNNGHNVYGLVRKNIDSFNKQNYKNILIEDISNNIELNKNISFDYYYHLAAKTHAKSNNYNEYYKVNVLGLKNILNSFNKLHIKKIIMLSSIKVNGEGFLSNDNFYSKNSEEKPEDAYGNTKLEAENLLKKYSTTKKINYVILRPPLVYGAGVKGNLSSLMNYIDKGVPMPVINTANMRSLISVNNLVNALITVGFNNKIINKTYLVSDDNPIRVEDLYKIIAKIMNKKIFLVKLPKFFLKILLLPIGKSKLVNKISASLIVDNKEIKNDTDWKDISILEDELKRMVDKRKIDKNDFR